MLDPVRHSDAGDHHIELFEVLEDVVDRLFLKEVLQNLPVREDSRREELRIRAAELLGVLPGEFVSLYIRAFDRDLADPSLERNEEKIVKLLICLVRADDIVQRLPHRDADLVALLEEAVQIVRRLAEHV